MGMERRESRGFKMKKESELAVLIVFSRSFFSRARTPEEKVATEPPPSEEGTKHRKNTPGFPGQSHAAIRHTASESASGGRKAVGAKP